MVTKSAVPEIAKYSAMILHCPLVYSALGHLLLIVTDRLQRRRQGEMDRSWVHLSSDCYGEAFRSLSCDWNVEMLATTS